MRGKRREREREGMILDPEIDRVDRLSRSFKGGVESS